MHAGLGRHQAKGIVTGQRERRALDAGFFARLIVEELALEAAALRPLQVHAEQHLGPVLRLGAAGAGMDRDDGVGAIVFAAEHLLDLGRFDLHCERVERALREVGGNVLARCAHSSRTPMSSIFLAAQLAQLDVLAIRRWRCSVFCASAWLFQKSGAAIFRSSCASSPGSCASSKIAPHLGGAFGQIGGAADEIVDDESQESKVFRAVSLSLKPRARACKRQQPAQGRSAPR